MTESRLDEAFTVYPRKEFLPEGMQDLVEYDGPIQIGYGQTNSQPYTVHSMLEWLAVQPGDNVLDVGSGSGWTTALLSYLVGPKGSVTAVERIPELLEMGQENCERAGIKNASFHLAQSVFGWPDGAPYDAILVSASAAGLPPELVKQLKAPGTLVIPIGHTIYEISKLADGSIDTAEHPGYSFVPLISS